MADLSRVASNQLYRAQEALPHTAKSPTLRRARGESSLPEQPLRIPALRSHPLGMRLSHKCLDVLFRDVPITNHSMISSVELSPTVGRQITGQYKVAVHGRAGKRRG